MATHIIDAGSDGPDTYDYYNEERRKVTAPARGTNTSLLPASAGGTVCLRTLDNSVLVGGQNGLPLAGGVFSGPSISTMPSAIKAAGPTIFSASSTARLTSAAGLMRRMTVTFTETDFTAIPAWMISFSLVWRNTGDGTNPVDRMDFDSSRIVSGVGTALPVGTLFGAAIDIGILYSDILGDSAITWPANWSNLGDPGGDPLDATNRNVFSYNSAPTAMRSAIDIGGITNPTAVDFTRSYTAKNEDNIPDGSTYARTIGTRVSAGKPFIDLSESINLNRTMDNVAATASRTWLHPFASYTDGSGRLVPSFDLAATQHLHKTFDYLNAGSAYVGMPVAAAQGTNALDNPNFLIPAGANETPGCASRWIVFGNDGSAFINGVNVNSLIMRYSNAASALAAGASRYYTIGNAPGNTPTPVPPYTFPCVPGEVWSIGLSTASYIAVDNSNPGIQFAAWVDVAWYDSTSTLLSVTASTPISQTGGAGSTAWNIAPTQVTAPANACYGMFRLIFRVLNTTGSAFTLVGGRMDLNVFGPFCRKVSDLTSDVVNILPRVYHHGDFTSTIASGGGLVDSGQISKTVPNSVAYQSDTVLTVTVGAGPNYPASIRLDNGTSGTAPNIYLPKDNGAGTALASYGTSGSPIALPAPLNITNSSNSMYFLVAYKIGSTAGVIKTFINSVLQNTVSTGNGWSIYVQQNSTGTDFTAAIAAQLYADGYAIHFTPSIALFPGGSGGGGSKGGGARYK